MYSSPWSEGSKTYEYAILCKFSSKIHVGVKGRDPVDTFVLAVEYSGFGYPTVLMSVVRVDHTGGIYDNYYSCVTFEFRGDWLLNMKYT